MQLQQQLQQQQQPLAMPAFAWDAAGVSICTFVLVK
jgi:hypothetical protein